MTRRYEILKCCEIMIMKSFTIESSLTLFDNKIEWTLWSGIGESLEPFPTYSNAANFIKEHQELFQVSDEEIGSISFKISRKKML